MEIKCARNNSECKVKIELDRDGYFWFTDKDGKTTLMYLDPNKIVEMIEKLRALLLEMTNS